MENTLKFRQDEFIENMESFELWNEKFDYLIETGESLPDMPSQMMSSHTLIQGCISRTYFKAVHTSEGLRIFGYSNSPVMCGILESVRTIFDGITISGADDEIYFHTASGLIDHLTPQRKSALLQIIDRIIHPDDL